MAAPFAKSLREEFSNDEIKEELNKIRKPVDVAVYSSKNYFNMGAILRIGHNFMVNNYHAIACPAFYEKAAMTARPWEKERIIHYDSPEDFIEKIKNRNVVAFERRWGMSSEDIRCFKYPSNPILLFGNEDEGVPDVLLAFAKNVVSIPVFGLVTDFNVAVAAGIALYDWTVKNG